MGVDTQVLLFRFCAPRAGFLGDVAELSNAAAHLRLVAIGICLIAAFLGLLPAAAAVCLSRKPLKYAALTM